MQRMHHRVGVTISGVVLVLVLISCSGDNTETPSPTPTNLASAWTTAATSPTPTSATTLSTAATPTTEEATSSVGAAIAKERAGEIATGKYGGRVLNVEADTEEGHPTWEVEVADSSQERIEVDVDRNTGEIVKVEKED